MGVMLPNASCENELVPATSSTMLALLQGRELGCSGAQRRLIDKVTDMKEVLDMAFGRLHERSESRYSWKSVL